MATISHEHKPRLKHGMKLAIVSPMPLPLTTPLSNVPFGSPTFVVNVARTVARSSLSESPLDHPCRPFTEGRNGRLNNNNNDKQKVT